MTCRPRFPAISIMLLWMGFCVPGCGGAQPTPSPEDKFRIIADAKEKALRQLLESKQSFLTGFKATIAEEKEDVQKRATYPFTGQIEFDYGAGKREMAPDGKSSTQSGGRGIAHYRYSKADQRWEIVDCAPPPNFMLPKPKDRIVEFEEIYRLFRD